MERRLKSFIPDKRSIDIVDDYALEFWARKLNVPEYQMSSEN